jgi:hypothetical protein
MSGTVQQEIIGRLSEDGLVDFKDPTQGLGLALLGVFAYAYALNSFDPEQALRKLNQWVVNEEIGFRKAYAEFKQDVDDLLLGTAAEDFLAMLSEVLGGEVTIIPLSAFDGYTPEADTFA